MNRLLRQQSNWQREEIQERSERLLVPLGDAHLGVWVQRDTESNTTAQVDSSKVYSTVRQLFGLPNHQSHGFNFGLLPHAAERAIVIPAFRELRPFTPPSESTAGRQQPKPNLANGEGLIAELDDWQRPKRPGTDAYIQAKERWQRLERFLRVVLEDPQAELEVAGRTDLHVRLAQAGEMLHIDSLGDGIKQVLMIAAACIYYDDSLILLEEPEIHLHAGLQRKLIKFLAHQTSSQYIIATHSAHILDMPDARIFHVVHDGVSTKVTPALLANEVHKVSQDLGYMASDLLQANYTVWVEGPSDRLYWRTWLRLADPELEEGVHYAIMTYGGYLVDGLHLRSEHDVESDLIMLLRLGRNCTLIADSDLKVAGGTLRPTVQRLQAEAQLPGSGNVLVPDWASTVENLLPRQLFRQAVLNAHPLAGRRLRTPGSHTPFDDPFFGMGKSTYSKVDIARAVCERLKAQHMGEPLLQAAQSLRDRIREANGLPAANNDESGSSGG